MVWLLSAAGLLALVILVVIGGGYLVPREHTASVERVHPASIETVWDHLTGVERFPEWRTDLGKVEVRERDEAGRPIAWTEHSKFGPLPIRVVEAEAPRRLVGRIDSDELGFGGTWTYRLEPLGPAETRLTITEDGTISNPMFRFLARFVFGYEATMRRYQDHLGASLSTSG